MSRRLTAISLFFVCLLLAIVALMRPQGRFQRTDISTIGAQVMVCLDVSKSMLAEDSKPNRLERAKAEIVDLLTLLDGDQVGLTAFAGNAAVMCPMTTDFGFLRLLMKEIGVHSVGRGGTKLAEPIKKAIEGFGQASDISRIVLLITDGEDQDSFPLEAAKQARERGIRIITIGFGDENGSSIEITDPETGATEFVRDESGKKVISKLDGDLLRQIALETEGVYIPAGTGSLDLQSIYEEHISKLVRAQIGEKQELIRTEYFQIPVAFSLLFLLAFLVLRSGLTPAGAPTMGNSTSIVLLALVTCVFATNTESFAQTTSKPEQTKPIDAESDGIAAASNAENDDQLAPREIYNQAIAMLHSDMDRADQLLQQARLEAGSDGEVRYRSAYNLGWILSKQADGKLESEPKEALQLLRQSADWFSRAIRIRPKESDARHNLEIVLRRAMELEDSLKKKDELDIAQSIDELIAQQRGVLSETGQLLETIRRENKVDPDAQQHRSEFRKLAVSQRQLLGDSQRILEQISAELEGNKDLKSEEMEQDQKLRIMQLSMAAPFLQNAVQRMAQARQQMRLRNENRAFRRESIAIDELKQSRDAFREPYEKIKILLNDSTSVFKQTSLLSAGKSQLNVSAEGELKIPAWLTKELLEESQSSITARTERLAEECNMMYEHVSRSDTTDTGQAAPDQEPPKQPTQQQIDDLAEISNHVSAASDQFQAARDQFGSDQLDLVLTHQMNAITSLQAAEEYLLDLRDLIETTYATESSVQKFYEQVTNTVTPTSDFLQFVDAAHEKNFHRLERLSQKIAEEATQISKPPTPGNESEPVDDEKQKLEKQRYEIAARLTSEIVDGLQQAEKLFDEIESSTESPSKDETSEPSDSTEDKAPTESTESTEDADVFSPAMDQVDQSVLKLQELRRLFFTIVELLQEKAQYQLDLNDKTEALKQAEDSIENRGPLSQKQFEIATETKMIGDELSQQAKSMKENPPPDGSDQQNTQQAAVQYEQAGKLVSDAFDKMQSAIDELKKSQDFDLQLTRTSQDGALQDLARAIQILQPPQDQQNENQQQNDEQSQENQDDQQSGEQEDEQPSNSNINQLLQMVQDREAQRRDEKAKRKAARMKGGVASDW